MIEVNVRYFASFKAQSGRDLERVTIEDSSPSALYAELKARFGWRFEATAIRLAVNGQLVSWAHALAQDDEVVFLPPFSGG